jgi:UTP--glucose-1-phosphate uridylyltransferase
MVMRDSVGCLSGMVELYEKVGGNIVAVAECDPALAHKYGIVGKGETLDGGFRITEMVEKPAEGTAPSNYLHQRPLHPAAGDLLHPGKAGARRRQRDPGHGRDAEAGREQPFSAYTFRR